jgi:ABC-type transport system substrate-binding protein
MDPKKASEFGPTAKYYTHDLAEAKKLLAAAGLGSGATFDFYSNADNTYGPIYSRQRDLFDGMFREGGFVPNQRLVPYGQFISNITYAYTSGNGYSGAVLRASSAAATIDQFLNRQHHPSGSHFGGGTPDGRNAKMGDPKVNDAIEKIKLETNKQRKQSMVHDLNRYFSGQVYQIPRPGQVKALTLSWPVIGNMNVYTRPLNGNVQTEEALHWWLDDSKPPIKPA